MVGKFGENIGVIYIKGLLSLSPLPIEYIFITYTNPSVFDFYFLIGKTVGKYVQKPCSRWQLNTRHQLCRTVRNLQNQTCDVEHEKTTNHPSGPMKAVTSDLGAFEGKGNTFHKSVAIVLGGGR
jgi:hypothetical protein